MQMEGLHSVVLSGSFENQESFVAFSIIGHQIVLFLKVRDQFTVNDGFFVFWVFAQSDQCFVERE